MTLIIVLAIIMAISSISLLIIHLAKRAGVTTTAIGSPQSSRSKDWEKLQNNFAIPIALILILGVGWLAWPEKFRQASATSGFWAGMILVILVGGILLRAAVPFKDSWIRKILLAGSFVIGIALVTGSFIPWDKLEALSQAQTAQSATTPTCHVQKAQIYRDKDTDAFIPPGMYYKINAPGDITYTLPNGEQITVKNGERTDVDKKLPSKFKMRGTPGTVEITMW